MRPFKILCQLGKIKIPKDTNIKIEIDVEQFANDIKSDKSIGRVNGVLGSLIKQINY